jgi:flagellar biosynthetic protein FliQ
MNETEIIETARRAILIALEVGGPIMAVGLIVGLIIALIQALTQVQEITLVFVPKIVAIFLAIFVTFPFMAHTLMAFMDTLADRIIKIGL